MGSELGESLDPQIKSKNGGGNSTISYSEIFRNHLPYYLSLGMSYDEYYRQDVCLVKAYRKADEIKKRRKNEELWLQGLYIYEALIDYAPLVMPFNKHPKPNPYLKEPIPITREMQEEKKRENYFKMLNKMKALAHIKKE